MNDRDRQRLLDKINEENSCIGSVAKVMVLVLSVAMVTAILVTIGAAVLADDHTSREALGMLWWMFGILIILMLIWVSAR